MMPKKTRFLLLFTAIAVASPQISSAEGGYNSSRHGGGYHHFKPRPSGGYTNPVSRIRGVGTFSSSSWALDLDRLLEGSVTRYLSAGPELAPKAKIIHVDSTLSAKSWEPRNACSYEAGVCVIRGGQ